MINIFAGSLVHQCLLLSSLRGVINKTHVDVDGVHARDAELHAEAVPGGDLVAVDPLARRLRLLARLELDQAPLLDHAVLHGDLQRERERER